MSVLDESLSDFDPEIAELIGKELERQRASVTYRCGRADLVPEDAAGDHAPLIAAVKEAEGLPGQVQVFLHSEAHTVRQSAPVHAQCTRRRRQVGWLHLRLLAARPHGGSLPPVEARNRRSRGYRRRLVRQNQLACASTVVRSRLARRSNCGPTFGSS
jgi:hypothetical protein